MAISRRNQKINFLLILKIINFELEIIVAHIFQRIFQRAFHSYRVVIKISIGNAFLAFFKICDEMKLVINVKFKKKIKFKNVR